VAATVFAPSRPFATAAAPARWSVPAQRSVFGDVVLLVFLMAQCLDGVLTYVGVVTYGTTIEANPIIATMMAHFGHGFALMTAKTVAGLLGICLHLRQVHVAVAVLALFYVAVAVIPWMAILFSPL
jgi:hypothetical protein